MEIERVVTSAAGGAINGATVSAGTRRETTNGIGAYSFASLEGNVDLGSSITVWFSAPNFVSSTSRITFTGNVTLNKTLLPS